MIERGDVVSARRRIGFDVPADDERFVVFQDDHLVAALPTVIVVPLDVWSARDVEDPLSLRISKREAGTKQDMAARLTLLGARVTDKLALHPSGRLAPSTLAELDERMRRVLGMP
jgi:mRNA-degrading endonuclease toxin of MazEF toxin-antitoxin module